MTLRQIIFILAITLVNPIWAQTTDEAKLANEYFLQGDMSKAEGLFEKLARDKQTIPQIHSNYFSLLVTRQDWKNADKYVERVLKFYPDNLQYMIDQLFLYEKSGRIKEKEEYIKLLINNYLDSQYQLNMLAQNSIGKGMMPEALVFLQQARISSGNPNAYSLDMAAVYRIQNNKAAMIDEYINYAMSNPNNLNYVKNIFQTLLVEEEELTDLENNLIRKAQIYPDNVEYGELLIWVALQRKNFYGAFAQARAIDRRTGKPGDRSMEIASIAMDNAAWTDAIAIYEYIIGTYGKLANYSVARQLLIKSKEGLVKSKYPLDTNNLKDLTNEYWYFYVEQGPSAISLTALQSKAMIHAFFLNEKDTAIALLEYILTIPRLGNQLSAEVKLSLADIYLLDDQPWEASLLYSQVEKDNKYSPTGYEAKLRNAKLHYYTGNFSLAKAHLDILKRATTKEISNDAINLSLLIDNNSLLDTSDNMLKLFAAAELLVYQNQFDQAESQLLDLIRNNRTHSLVDESYWILANINLRQGKFETSLNYLDKIINEHSWDILGDDALFAKGNLLENQLGNKEAAQEIYRQFLTKYPGSMNAAEARKRFRILRGDLIN